MTAALVSIISRVITSQQFFLYNSITFISISIASIPVPAIHIPTINISNIKNVTSEHLQSFFDLLSFGGVHPDGKERKGYSKDYIHSFSAVMQQSFRFAVFPKQYITFNPMQYIKLRYQTDEVDLFSDEDMDGNIQPISREDYERLLAYLKKRTQPQYFQSR